MAQHYRGFHNSGPRGERDHEDGGNEALYPARQATPVADKALEGRRAAYVNDMIQRHIDQLGFSPNAAMVANYERGARLNVK